MKPRSCFSWAERYCTTSSADFDLITFIMKERSPLSSSDTRLKELSWKNPISNACHTNTGSPLSLLDAICIMPSPPRPAKSQALTINSWSSRSS